jgi:ABC-type transporter Mla subunit MlaD
MIPFKLRHGREIVTIFTLAALGIFIFLASVIAYNNNLFRSRVNFYTLVTNAYGLNSMPPIYFKGFAIGRVKNFHLTKDNRIRVNFYVFEDFYDRIIPYSVVSINTNPISGDINEFQLITPENKGDTIKPMPAGSLIPDLKSAEAQSYIAQGKLVHEFGGIEGILDKSNQILKEFIQHKASEKINSIIADSAKIISTLEGTVKSYGPDGKGEGHKQMVNLLDKVNNTMNAVLDSANYIKETIEVVHRNRKDLAPLILNTNKTLEKAQDTLDGINQNPLLKGGIKDDRSVHGIEMVQ